MPLADLNIALKCALF